MSTFRFRLETLQRLRVAERDRRLGELAQAQQAADIVRGQQRDLEAECDAMREQVRQLSSPGSANIDALMQVHRHELILKADVRQLAAQLVQIEAEVARRRQAVVEADRQVRVLEKLCERKLAEHNRREAKADARQMDELGLQLYVRSGAARG